MSPKRTLGLAIAAPPSAMRSIFNPPDDVE
jgi:hypothetical protein